MKLFFIVWLEHMDMDEVYVPMYCYAKDAEQAIQYVQATCNATGVSTNWLVKSAKVVTHIPIPER